MSIAIAVAASIALVALLGATSLAACGGTKSEPAADKAEAPKVEAQQPEKATEKSEPAVSQVGMGKLAREIKPKLDRLMTESGGPEIVVHSADCTKQDAAKAKCRVRDRLPELVQRPAPRATALSLLLRPPAVSTSKTAASR